MTLRDALAVALHEQDDPDFGYPAGWTPIEFADAILSDPAFRAALTEAVGDALYCEGLQVRSYEGPWLTADEVSAAIVARMLP